MNLIVKKPKTDEAATSPSVEKAEDGGDAEVAKAAAVSDACSPKETKSLNTTPAAADSKEDQDVFASLCEAYGDSDDSG